MVVKSVLQIDVNDTRFRDFKRLYDQYERMLRGQPAAWQQVNAKIAGTKASFETLVAKMAAANVQTKLLAKAQEQADNITRRTSERWTGIARSALSFAISLREITADTMKLAKVTGIVTGLLGAGGLYGIDRLALSAAGARRGALGMGVGVGPRAAFETAFQRFVDPDFLDRVAHSRFSVEGRVGLLGAGMTQGEMAGDTAQVGRALLLRLKQIADATDPGLMENIINARRLPTTREEMIRLRETSPEEIGRQFNQQASFAGRLQLDDTVLRKWQDFVTQLDFAGRMMNKTLVQGLVPLADPLARLSETVTNAIATFMSVVEKRHWIDQFATGIEKLADYIGTDDFAKKVATFVEGIGQMADAVAKFLPSVKTAAHVGSAASDIGKGLYGGFVTVPGAIVGGLRDKIMGYNEGGIAARFGSNSISIDQAMQVIRQRENSGDAATSPAGAIGRFQIMPGTALQYGGDPSRLKDPVYNEQLARKIVLDLVNRYHGNLSEVMAAYNAGPGRANRFHRSGDNPAVLKPETQRYISGTGNVTVRIDDNTGGNVNVSTNALKN